MSKPRDTRNPHAGECHYCGDAVAALAGAGWLGFKGDDGERREFVACLACKGLRALDLRLLGKTARDVTVAASVAQLRKAGATAPQARKAAGSHYDGRADVGETTVKLLGEPFTRAVRSKVRALREWAGVSKPQPLGVDVVNQYREALGFAPLDPAKVTAARSRTAAPVGADLFAPAAPMAAAPEPETPAVPAQTRGSPEPEPVDTGSLFAGVDDETAEPGADLEPETELSF